MRNAIEIDIIIASYAHTEELLQVTKQAINSLKESEDSSEIKFNVIVLESEKSLKPYQYPNTTTVYLDIPFGYHKYMNEGINLSTASFVCICNNDLYFHPKWATEILKPFQQFEDVVSASPYCSKHHPSLGIKINDGIKLGYRIREQVAGWCIFFRRNLLQTTGVLDPNFIFWCADNDYANTLYSLKLNHILVTTSIVDHLESITLNRQTEERKLELTENETIYYQKKWKVRLGEGWTCFDDNNN